MTSDPLAIDERTLKRLRDARKVVAFTGAGISAESGIPTYRSGNDALWGQNSAKALASPQGFAANPKLVWGWYALRRRQVQRDVTPNAGHEALVKLASYYPELTVVTQNVDGLHTRAGSQNVVELHGSLFRFICSQERRPVTYENPRDGEPLTLEAIERGEGPEPPSCPECGAPLRPDVVWFGETLPVDAYRLAEQKASASDVFFVIGTSAVVYPAAALPDIARRAGALTVEVNPEVTSFTSHADVSLRGKAGEILPRLVDLITGDPRAPAGDPPAPATPRSDS